MATWIENERSLIDYSIPFYKKYISSIIPATYIGASVTKFRKIDTLASERKASLFGFFY